MYVYRYDRLKCLQNQRADPVLRGRRVKGPAGSFDHQQVLSALERLPADHGVYRFCVWRTWEAALKHAAATNSAGDPIVLQRIRSDAPGFDRFSRDDDEYLVGDAWIYWQSVPVPPNQPEWSPDGIPHWAIEALHPNGHWQPLDSADFLGGDHGYLGWNRRFIVGWGGGPCMAYVQHRARYTESGRHVWILLRQPSSQGTALINFSNGLAELVERELAVLGHLPLSMLRWAVALEAPDRILVKEFFPRRVGVRPHLFMEKLVSWVRPSPRWEVIIDLDEARFMTDQEVRLLYIDFSAADSLRLSDVWRYDAALFRPER
ncbi:hypothetical protein ACFONG_10250 [Uliginosibacterium paludis]|uniref:Uncharacterized protein n=1 Tax=Uliginosibacterium paludis TaxID=1615952 RepID=A0ABV2CML5_9RHOO